MHQVKVVRNIWLGIENLLLHKLRSMLTMLGIVFGVGSVVAMLAVGEGASKQALDQIRKLGSNNLIISSKKAVEDEASTTAHSHMSIYGLTYEDYARVSESFSTISQAAPVKLLRKRSRFGERVLELRVVGTTATWFELVPREVVAGRVLVPSDDHDRSPVAVLTEHGARKILATEHTIGESIRIGIDVFEVVGIVKSQGGVIKGQGGQGENIQIPDRNVDVYIPMEVARIYFGDVQTRTTAGGREREKVELHQIIVEVDGMEHVEATGKGIEEMIKRFHKKKDYDVTVPLALLRQAEDTKRRFNIVLGSIAGISLLVGGIGIMNIMLATVTERTREIGIRRAIGAKRNQIVGQFLIETSVLSTIGGLIGIGFGVLVPSLITHFAGMPTVITAVSVFLPLFISAAIGIIFGLYPAFRAAKVDPIVALRHE